jgi:hypothetical protein
MTAINPAKLKIQCAELGESFQNLPLFTTGLHDLLAFYSARIRQTNLSKTPLTLQTYQVPAPVLRALELEFCELIEEYPDEGFLLIDALWKEEWLEFRQLAASLLGYLPITAPKKVLDRIQIWIRNSTSEELNRLIMTKSVTQLAVEKPSQVLELLKSLASSNIRADRQTALFGLLQFGEDPSFDNLPKIFNILRDILHIDESAYIKEISAVIHSLQRKSDQETAYFLVRQMATAPKPRIFRVIRQVLGFFSKESQQVLKESLNNYG